LSAVATIIVTYQPDLRALASSLAAHARTQAGHYFVVDNGSEQGAEVEQLAHHILGPTRCTVLLQQTNLGLATALNAGIAAARDRDCTHVALFDQDTHPADNTLALLLDGLQRLQAEGRPVAAVGPSHVDMRTGAEYPQRLIQGLSMRMIWPSREAVAAVEVSFVITSGALIPLAVLDAVGPMRDELFIDFIDIEWCFRASAAGLRSYCIRSAVVKHTLGDRRRVFLGREVSVHSATRYYYMFRNALYLMRLGTIPLRFRVLESLYLLCRGPVFLMLSGPSWQHARLMALGIAHGLAGRMGPLSQR
jgi:rhamnosyltransferase